MTVDDGANEGKAVQIDGVIFRAPPGKFWIHNDIAVQAQFDLGWTAVQFNEAFLAGRVRFGYVDDDENFTAEE